MARMGSNGRGRAGLVAGLLLTMTAPAAAAGATDGADAAPVPATGTAEPDSSTSPLPRVAATHHATEEPIDYVVPRSAAARVAAGGVRRWRGNSIRYYETLPEKWQWSLDRAIEHWNSSGANMKFVRVARESRAQLTIGYGSTGYADGLATIGPARNAFVHLSRSYRHRDAHDPWTRVWVGRLMAHELGHVVGFGHTSSTCSLMVAVLYSDRCDLLVQDRPGYYFRRWIDKALLTRFIDVYGGRSKRPRKVGLIAPLPPQLDNVIFSGGDAVDRPVSIEWTPPKRFPTGSRVEVTTWQDASCDRLDLFASDEVGPAAGSWVDPEPEQGAWCYGVRIVNRYGAARPAFVEKLQRWAPTPATPAVTYLAWDKTEQAHRFGWVKQKGTELAVIRNPDDPATCPASYGDGWADLVYPDSDGNYSVYAYEAQECLSFFAVNEFKTSTPVNLNVSVPAPTITPTVGPLVIGEWGEVRATVTLSDNSYGVGIEVLPVSCPDIVPDGLEWNDSWRVDADDYEFYPEAESGPNCALFTAIDYSFSGGLHGPVVMREFQTNG